MPKASVKRLIDNKKDKLIEFVLDIEKYPEFVPFCQGSKVYEKKQEGDLTLIVADLTIGKGPFVDTYKSDVKFNKKTDHIYVVNLGGPLNHLENNWKFIEVGNDTVCFFLVSNFTIFKDNLLMMLQSYKRRVLLLHTNQHKHHPL